MYQQAKQYQVGIQASYYMANEWGYYHVTLQVLNQQIAVHENVFRKVLDIDYKVECGCREITIHQAVELGFVFPDKQRYEKPAYLIAGKCVKIDTYGGK